MQPQSADLLEDRPSEADYITMGEVINKYLAPQYGHSWAGYPTLMAGMPMELHPRFPFADLYTKPFPDPDGIVKDPPDIGNPFSKLFDLCMVSPAWGLRSEIRALRKLKRHINHMQFHAYFMTGAFPAISERSKVGYLFRRLRPTIAFALRETHSRFLAALCSHPIGFYSGTHAGALCPTDDVLAQYLLMVADEHYFWRISNQHPWEDQHLWT